MSSKEVKTKPIEPVGECGCEKMDTVTISIPRHYFDLIKEDSKACIRSVEGQLEYMLREYYFEDEEEVDLADENIEDIKDKVFECIKKNVLEPKIKVVGFGRC